MDKTKLISEGNIEAYSCGAADDDLKTRIEQLIANVEEVRTEYESVQKLIYLLAAAKFLKPSESVKSTMLRKINDRRKIRAGMSSENISHSRTYFYLFAAAAVFFAVSLIINIYLLNELRQKEQELALLTDRNRLNVQELKFTNERLSQMSSDMEIVKDRNYRMTELKGLDISPDSYAVTFWNPENQKLYIEVMNLPVPPKDRQYQLWAVSDGIPKDAGLMDVDPADKSLHKMKDIRTAEAFAITLEPKGGSALPSPGQMYAMGKL